MTRPLIAVLDYGIGNLRSAQKSLERMGADARLTADPSLIADAAGVVLPGVGAFGPCMDALCGTGLDEQAGFSLPNKLRRPTHARGHYGETAGLRFQHDIRPSFRMTRQDKDIGRLHPLRNLLRRATPDKVDLRCDPFFCTALL